MAVATVIFLFIAAEPMLEKLDRIKVKYGLVEKIPTLADTKVSNKGRYFTLQNVPGIGIDLRFQTGFYCSS